jgi:histidine phosphotransfer protein HptB
MSSEMLAIDASVIAELRALGGSDDTFLRDLFAEYIDQAEETIETLRTALSASDRISFARAAHSLAGSSLNVGATGLGVTCRAIEHEMQSETARPAPTHLQIIESELQRTLAAIASHAII